MPEKVFKKVNLGILYGETIRGRGVVEEVNLSPIFIPDSDNPQKQKKIKETISISHKVEDMNSRSIDVEETVTKLVQYLPRKLRSHGRDLGYHFFSLFPTDAPHLLREVFTVICHNPQFQCPAYFSLMTELLFDSASLGYPSVLQGFTGSSLRAAKDVGLSIYDPKMLLALRVYIADGLSQVQEFRKQLLHEVSEASTAYSEVITNGEYLSNRKNIHKIPAIFGQMPEIEKGILKSNWISNFKWLEPDYNQRFTHTRSEQLGIYLPDMDRINELLLLGEVCGRPLHADRKKTFEAFAKIDDSILQELFPDQFIAEGESFNVDEEPYVYVKNLVAGWFGSCYEQAKELMFYEPKSLVARVKGFLRGRN